MFSASAEPRTVQTIAMTPFTETAPRRSKTRPKQQNSIDNRPTSCMQISALLQFLAARCFMAGASERHGPQTDHAALSQTADTTASADRELIFLSKAFCLAPRPVVLTSEQPRAVRGAVYRTEAAADVHHRSLHPCDINGSP